MCLVYEKFTGKKAAENFHQPKVHGQTECTGQFSKFIYEVINAIERKVKAIALKRYGLELMINLPCNDPSNAHNDKIYISHTGEYIIRDIEGTIQQGQIDINILTLDNLKLKLTQPEFKENALKQISNTDHIHLEKHIFTIEKSALGSHIRDIIDVVKLQYT